MRHNSSTDGPTVGERSLEDALRPAVREVERWLGQPCDASRGLEELQQRIRLLAGVIGASAKREALKALASSEDEIRRQRLCEVAEAIVTATKPLGIPLRVASLRRRRPRRSAKPRPDPQPRIPATADDETP